MKVWSAVLMILLIVVDAQSQGRRIAPGFRGRSPIQSIPPVVSPVIPVSPQAPFTHGVPVVPPTTRVHPGMRPGFIPGRNPNFRQSFYGGLGVYPAYPIGTFPYTGYYPYDIYSPINYPPPNYSAEQYQPVEEYQPAQPDVNQLNDQIQRLTDEVQRLQDELSGASTSPVSVTPPPGPTREMKPPAPPPPVIPTIIVFKNGRRLESRGYAVVDQTLWVFSESGSETFQLSDLDVATTRSENEKRGITLRLP